MLDPVPAPAPSAPKVYRPRAAGALARVALALACFALVLMALRPVAAPAGGSVIGGKREYWRAHAHEYDTVFIGSSHVLRAFVPAEFDRVMADEYHAPTRSFNFGVQAVHLLEQRYLLREALDERPDLARVFFEYQWFFPQIDPQNAFNARTVYWHDPETTALAVERTLHWGHELGDAFHYVEDASQRHSIFTVLDRALPPALRASEEHVQHGLTDLLLIGRGKDVLRGALGLANGQTGRNGDQDGYLSLEDEDRVLAAQGDEHNSYRARRERFLANREAYLHDVDLLDSAPSSFGDADWIDAELTRVDDFELIADIARETRARGVEFVLVILPSQSADRAFEERLLAELDAPVLRYDLPERYPELYAIENRWDSGHLSAEGARIFSRMLARDYAGAHATPRDGGHGEGGAPQ